jgi:hypothetical protein
MCLFAGVASCGGSAPAPVAPALAQSAAPAAAPPAPDVSAVAEPKGIVVYGRLSKLSASFATVHAWSKLPVPQAEQVTELVANAPFGPLVDLDRPFDLAVALPSGRMNQVAAAVAAPVKDPEQSRAALSERYKLVPGDNGVTLIQKAGDSPSKPPADDDDDKEGDDDERACELAPAAGDAPVRLVCASDARALSVLGPWLTRTAPRTSFPADLHVELRLQPVRPLIDQQRRLLGPMLSTILGGGGAADAGARELLMSTAGDLADFAADLDGVSIDLALGDGGANANTTIRLAGTSSALSRMAVGHPERNGPAPDVFWQLPGDADFATFSRGVDDADLARMKDLFLKAIGAELGEQGAKEPDRKAVMDALAGLGASWPVAYASGLDDAARGKMRGAEKAGAPQGQPTDPSEAKRLAAAEALLGWRVFAIDQPSAKTVAGLKALAAAWSRPGIAAAWRAKDKDSAPPTFRSVPLPKGAALPQGAAHYVVEIALPAERVPRRFQSRPKPPQKGNAAGPSKPLVLHVLVAGDASRTWVGVAGDESLAAAKLAATLGQGQGKLSSRTELSSFKAGPLGSGGFFTVRGVYELLSLGMVVSEGLSGAVGGLDEVAQTPGQGALAIPFTTTTQPGGPPTSIQATLQVPRGAIDDVVAALLKKGVF